jgi:hypothetical protein
VCSFTRSEAEAGQTDKIPHKKSSPENRKKKMKSREGKKEMRKEEFI